MLLLFSFLSFLIVSCSADQQHTFSPSSASSSIPRSQLSLTAISRTVELGGATSKATTVYSLKPSSDSNDEQVFVFAVDAKDAANLSWIEAYTGRTGNTKKPVKVEALSQPTEE